MTTTYTPRAGSLPSQVIGFFQNNPDEHLNLEDIADKFDATRGNIHTVLKPALEAGLLTRERNDDGDYIYKPAKAKARPTVRDTYSTPSAPEAPQPATTTKPPQAPAAAKVTGTQVSLRKMIDIEALTVDDDVPFLMNAHMGGASKWEPLFTKLTKPGQSVKIPGDCKAALATAARNWSKKNPGTYRVAMTGAGTARVWRTA